LFLATTLNYMDRISLNQMALQIQAALSIDNQQYSWLESGFSFAFAVGALLTGFVVDRASVRWVYPAVVLGWSAAGVLTGYATGFWWLFGCRIALGLFEAGNWPCGIRTTKAVLRPDERSFGNSLFQSGTAVGAVVTPVLILLLLHWADPLAPQRNAVMAVTGGTYAAVSGAPTDAWRLPFRVIGLIGLVWVALWFLTVPRKLLRAGSVAGDQGATRYRDVFRDRRFWGLLIMVIGINVAWHTYRAWLPKYLQERRDYTFPEMTGLMTVFYLFADIGSWTIGLLTLVVMRRGRGGHSARILAFTGCSGLAIVSVLVPFAPRGWELTAAVLVFAFAALGLFPTYFAMSQELSVAHQGKVTGTLGAGAHMFLALVVYPIQGRIIQQTKSYDEVLAVAGLFPAIALAVLVWLWRPPPAPVEPPSS
jgi:ACS family hexuronate transporter-like MFS transporter